MYYNMQNLTKERNLNRDERLMDKNELGYNHPRVNHLL